MQSFKRPSILLLLYPLLTTMYLMFSLEILKEMSTMGRTYSRIYNIYLKKKKKPNKSTGRCRDVRLISFRKIGDLGINMHISWDYYGQKWEGLCSCSYAGLMYAEIKTDLGYDMGFLSIWCTLRKGRT